jgi:F-type H+-transporting ATPase subunit delta
MIAVPEAAEGEEAPKNELRDFLLGIPLNGDRRKEVIDSLAKEVNMKKETADFLKLLIDVNRMDAIEDIINVFEERYNQVTDTQVHLRILSWNS